jgi:hypothetical protein
MKIIRQNEHTGTQCNLETGGATRNRNPQICFARGTARSTYYIAGTLPTSRFRTLASAQPGTILYGFLQVALLTGASRTAELAYISQRDWVRKAFNYAGGCLA